ncbi:retropepsin-like aspartic protease family protein [Acidovorax lacteus]|uniref:retropepsin-like aspartic protease family protein n=1 Tax=Acidovorax lacteus TaxID=1924988 RepID=UPI003CD07056
MMPAALRPRRLVQAACVALLGAMALGQASGQTVALAGVLGSKALLVIDGNAPRALAPGETHGGVRLMALQGDTAQVDVGGDRRTLRLGEAPVSVGTRANGRRVVLSADGRGHFVSLGQINGRTMQYMVDTGASTVAIGVSDAERMGLDYRQGQRVTMGTANGVAQGWRIVLDTVRLGDVMLYGVEAVVTPQPMPFVLLGNNVLGEFKMTRTPDQMVLEKR